MELDDLCASGLLMKAVGVLVDHPMQAAGPLQLDQRQVGRIGVGADPPMGQAIAPVDGRALAEFLDGGHLVRIELGLQPALSAAGGQSALLRDSGAGEGDRRAGPAEQLRPLGQRRTGDHAIPANRSVSGVDAATSERTRSNSSRFQARGPTVRYTSINQLSSGICVRWARMAAIFCSR